MLSVNLCASIAIVLATLNCFHQVEALKDPVFFTEIDFKGTGIAVNNPNSGQGCIPLTNDIAGKVSSVNTGDRCLMLYDSSNCSGGSTRVAPGTKGHNDLRKVNFNDKARAFKVC